MKGDDVKDLSLTSNFQNKDVLSTANVWLGNKPKINLMSEKPLKILVNRSSLRMIKTTILWNDKDLNIKWPIKKPLLSKKDKIGLEFKEFIRSLGKERE